MYVLSVLDERGMQVNYAAHYKAQCYAVIRQLKYGPKGVGDDLIWRLYQSGNWKTRGWLDESNNAHLHIHEHHLGTSHILPADR